MAYLVNNVGEVAALLWQHLQMTLTTLAIAVLIAIPIALLIMRFRWLSIPVMGLLGIFYTIPSLALIIFSGAGFWTKCDLSHCGHGDLHPGYSGAQFDGGPLRH